MTKIRSAWAPRKENSTSLGSGALWPDLGSMTSSKLLP